MFLAYSGESHIRSCTFLRDPVHGQYQTKNKMYLRKLLFSKFIETGTEIVTRRKEVETKPSAWMGCLWGSF